MADGRSRRFFQNPEPILANCRHPLTIFPCFSVKLAINRIPAIIVAHE
jgi:hypothetical protein